MTRLLTPGEVAPWFHAAALDSNPNYAFNSVGGRWIVLLMLGSGTTAGGQDALDLLARHRDMFDDNHACFFGVTTDPQDAAHGRIAQRLPGMRWFLDYDGAVSRQYGALRRQAGQDRYHPHWLLIDPMMRVRRVAPLAEGEALFAMLRTQPPPLPDIDAPVLIVPDIFPPAMCRHLITLHTQSGGEDSGFMREENGITVLKLDHSHKKRQDHVIQDRPLIDQLKARMAQTLRPMIQRAFQFDVTRVERFLIACYDADQGGYFRPHRDNTTKGTAHRRFACTINLNAEDFEGGELRFPEFGARSYRPPTGGALIFSCSLLHEALPVTSGRRYAFLPFFYDDAAARIREQNVGYLAPDIGGYMSGLQEEAAE
ncbi:peroxiredoxin [Sphingobium lactosutens]|uniref:2OG-Fe(II) oxygenase family protein n=1 Tax=Sphingobium lactosutens TaxID=522773 RepID=UPI0015BCEA6D|nr:2OG-Fe(II) oxygenase [Sphingobium lactosutens]NWK95285.1 peroxiredoxin [Sphingobium lactosutens]